MPLALKAQWTVQAGVIPGEPEPQYTRSWPYTSADYEADGKLLPDQQTRFAMLRIEAQAYAHSITDPRSLNWVRLDWIWL